MRYTITIPLQQNFKHILDIFLKKMKVNAVKSSFVGFIFFLNNLLFFRFFRYFPYVFKIQLTMQTFAYTLNVIYEIAYL